MVDRTDADLESHITSLFDQWLIGGPLDGCVAIWAGKTHVRCVHVYTTTSEQRIRQDIYSQEDTDILRLSLKRYILYYTLE